MLSVDWATNSLPTACMSCPYRDAYTHIEVSAIDKDGHVVGALVPNVTEDDSLSGCSSADPRKCHPQGQVYVGFS